MITVFRKWENNIFYNMKRIIKKWDVILVFFFLLLTGVLLLAGAFRKNGSYVIVDNGKESRTYSLSKNQIITIENPENHGKNVVCIQDGAVTMTEASCPDLICVHHKPIHKNGEVIVCVPNDVTLQVVSDVENGIDN